MNTNDIHIALPASKSLSNRWIILNYLMGNMFHLTNLSTSDDTQLLRKLLVQLQEGKSNVFDCRNAGTVERFLVALLAITPGNYVLTGDERLRERPISDLVDALNGMGCEVNYMSTRGQLPLAISGTLPRRKMAYIDSSMSSQFVSGLMLVAPALPNGMTIVLTSRVISRPYIDMTYQVLLQAGIPVKYDKTGRSIMVQPIPKIKPTANIIAIEQDWSAASYFYEIIAMFPQLRIRLSGLSLESTQGDSIAAKIFESLGVATYQVRSPYKKQSTSLRIQSNGKVEKKFNFNFRNYPDLVPTVAVTCAYLGVSATFSGIQSLHLKESDRVEALVDEINAMHGKAFIKADGNLAIRPAKLRPTRPVHTYNDHRIAMAFAPLTLVFPDMVIESPEVVSKSFPDFWNQVEIIRQQFNHE